MSILEVFLSLSFTHSDWQKGEVILANAGKSFKHTFL